MQRNRILTATVELVAEGGAQTLTIATVCQRAGVSRRTFYDLFPDRQACLLAAFERAADRAGDALAVAVQGQVRWRTRMRAGLVALLCFLEEHPTMARLLIVEALSAGPLVLERRAQIAKRLIAAVEEGRDEAKAANPPPPLTAEATVGAVFAVIHARLLEQPPGGQHACPLIPLANQLMSVIVQPYLGIPAARREIDAPTPTPATTTTTNNSHNPRPSPKEPFKDLPIRLTYRTMRVLTSLAATPGASSKQLAQSAQVSDEGQMSRLLTRLEHHGLIENHGGDPTRGEPKAWTLTNKGQDILHAAGAGGVCPAPSEPTAPG